MPPIAPLGLLLKYELPVYRWLGESGGPGGHLHGTDDEVIPFDSSLRLLAHARSPATFVPVEGGRHR